MVNTKYLTSHNNVATIVYLELPKKYKITPDSGQPYYEYEPPSVVENSTVKIYWDKGIQTDKTIMHNRPDITVIRKKENINLIDVSIPNTNIP